MNRGNIQMKRETKELVAYMYDEFNNRIEIPFGLSPERRKSAEEYNSIRDKIQKFLKSLPEIEEKLCFGGYIQDKNGTPCCQGDKVKYKDIPVDKVGAGTLRWNVDKSRFEIYWKDEDLKGLVDTMNIKTDFAPRDIEKVENDD